MSLTEALALAQLVEATPPLAEVPSPAHARQLREAAGLTRPLAAAVLGVHSATVASWDWGKQEPTVRHELAYRKLLAYCATVAPETARECGIATELVAA